MRTALIAGLATIAALPAAAVPITTTYSVQFISVCDDFGNFCASVPVPSNPTDPARNLNNPLDIMNRAYEQQGIRFAPVMSGSTIDIKHLNATALQNPDLRVDAQLNSVTSADGFAQLTRGTQLQSIGVSPSSTTLNIFYVNDLRALDVNGSPIPNSVLRGVGWLNGNGVIVDKEARLDTLAHEVGHNLGLVHDPNAKNLMASGDNRSPVTTTINDVAPNGQLLDQLTAAQGTEARGPLFANGTARVFVDGLEAISGVDFEDNVSAARIYDFDFDPTPTQRTLTKVQFFYNPGTEVVGGNNAIDTPTARILELIFGTPLLPGGEFAFHTSLGHTVHIGEPSLPVDPLFIRYVFDNGVASQALFDAGDDMASDDPTSQFLFLGTPDVNGRPLALQGSEIEISVQVPEPGTLALFASALLACFCSARRRAAPVR